MQYTYIDMKKFPDFWWLWK